MRKIDWKAVVFDCVKACIAVIIGALAGSCTVHHLSITSVAIPDSAFVEKVDNSIKSWTNYADSVTHHIKNEFHYESK